MDRKELGQHLRRLRESKGLGIRDASRRAGISHGYISMMERGTRGPTVEILRKLAPVYEVTENQLVGLLDADMPLMNGNEEEEVERAYQFVVRDPRFRFGTRPDGAEMTPKGKRFIVEIYEKLTGKRLLG